MVAAIFCPTCPLLPMPETMTRPCAPLIKLTASLNGAAKPLSSDARNAARPSASKSSVRIADLITDGSADFPPGMAFNVPIAPAATIHPIDSKNG